MESKTESEQWPQVVFEVTRAQCDHIEEALFAVGALSVIYQDQQDQPVLEPGPGEIRLWEKVRLIGLFDLDSDIQAVESDLCQYYDFLPPRRWEGLEDRQWETAWMDDFRPMSFGSRLWIYPTHIEPAIESGANAGVESSVVLRLDPGLAFGTGNHATTRLCLEWLDSADLAGRQVLDYGCGSGILAIAALKLGAGGALAVDIDEQALDATRSNAVLNHVASDLAVGLVSAQSPTTAKPVDLILANILFQPLVALAPAFSAGLKPGGDLVLSGVLAEQVDALKLRYNQWFVFKHIRHLQGWSLMHGTRKQPD